MDTQLGSRQRGLLPGCGPLAEKAARQAPTTFGSAHRLRWYFTGMSNPGRSPGWPGPYLRLKQVDIKLKSHAEAEKLNAYAVILAQ